MNRIIFLFFLFVVFGCTETDRTNYLPGYSGQIGEVVVVCSKAQWSGDLGKKINNTLAAPIYGMPQDEPLFTPIQVNHKNFERALATHRNVFKVTINDSLSTEKFHFNKNVYAKGQMLLEVKARTENKALDLINENKNAISSLFGRAELNRLMARNKKQGPKEVNAEVKQHLGYQFLFQKDFSIRVKKQGFIWARLIRERPIGGFQHQIDQNIIIAEVPYYNKLQFLDSLLNHQRDSILANIPGPSEGSFVTTDYKYVPPMYTEIELANNYAKLMQGLWRMENNFMGGPLISYSFVHPTEDKIVHVIGFVFAPQFDKREYVRELDAILRSVTFS